MSATPYKMPYVYLGQVVLWKHAREALEPAPAIVTRVGQCAISVIIFPTDSRVGITRDGVRHFTDPALHTVVSDAGVWCATEGDTHRAVEAASKVSK